MPFKNPDEYRQRAKRARALATGAKEPSVVHALLRVAADYDSMAEQVKMLKDQKRSMSEKGKEES